MSKEPLVSLLVLNWNGANCLKTCLDSLLSLAYKNVEIIVVDNCSTDNSIKILHEYKTIKTVVTPRNLGYTGGNNFGFKCTRGKYVATLNNDVVVPGDWLKEPIEYLEKYKDVGLISCRQMNYYNPEVIDSLYHYPSPYLLFLSEGHGKKFRPEKWGRPGYVISANGASAIIRKDVIKDLGGFDERFFAYHEDADFGINAFYKGWKCLYVPNSIIYHMESKSFKIQSKTYTYYFERNRYFFILKNYALSFIIKSLPLILYNELRIVSGITILHKQFLVYIKARLYVLLRLPRLLYENFTRRNMLKKKQQELINYFRNKILYLQD